MLSPKQFGDKAESYFEDCATNDEPPTVPGLCYYMGFAQKQSFYDYKKDPDYEFACNRAYLAIEKWLAKSVVKKETFSPGQIFTLKSIFGYEDKQSIDHMSSDGSMRPTTIKLMGPDDDC